MISEEDEGLEMTTKEPVDKHVTESSSFLISPSPPAELLDETTLEMEDEIFGNEEKIEKLDKARKWLYCAHFASRFTEIGWQFCLVIFLTALAGYESLTLVSVYGLFTGLVVCFAGPFIGKYVDSTRLTRLQIAKHLILGKNLFAVAVSVCCFLLLRMVKEDGHTDADDSETQRTTNFIPPFNIASCGLLLGIHVFGALALLADAGLTVAIERDWTVVMSKSASSGDILYNDVIHDRLEGGISNIHPMPEKKYSATLDTSTLDSTSVGDSCGTLDTSSIRDMQQHSWLSHTNTTMRQIYLLCRIVGPAAAGFFLSVFDNSDPSTNETRTDQTHFYLLSYAAILIGTLLLISLWSEFVCIGKIYELIPALSDRQSEEIHDSRHEIEDEPMVLTSGHDCCRLHRIFKLAIPRSFLLYFEQPIARGGVALSFL